MKDIAFTVIVTIWSAARGMLTYVPTTPVWLGVFLSCDVGFRKRHHTRWKRTKLLLRPCWNSHGRTPKTKLKCLPQVAWVKPSLCGILICSAVTRPTLQTKPTHRHTVHKPHTSHQVTRHRASPTPHPCNSFKKDVSNARTVASHPPPPPRAPPLCFMGGTALEKRYRHVYRVHC